MIRTVKFFALSLLATTGIAVTARAADTAPAISFHPAKPWAVAEAGSAGTCGMSTEFNNGYVVKFGGTNKAPRTLDVDFQQDIFVPGKGYETTLTVPGNAASTVSTRASSASTLTLNISGQSDFFKALTSASVMDLGVEGNNFRFYMTGLSGAAQSFDNCLMKSPAPVQQAAASPAATVNESIALEQQEKTGQPLKTEPLKVESVQAEPVQQAPLAVTEISKESPQPVIQPLTVTEKIKLGDRDITEGELKAIDSSPAARRRMSEELAAKIARNPELVQTRKSDEQNPGAESAKNLSEPPFIRESLGGETTAQEKPRTETTAEEELAMSETAAPVEPVETVPGQKSASVNSEQTVIFNGKPMKLADVPAPAPSSEPATEQKPQELAKAAEPLPEPLSVPEEKAPEVVNMKTPEMIVRKETARMEADFTDVGVKKQKRDSRDEQQAFFEATPEPTIEPEKIEPASNLSAASPVPQTMRDPELIRKVSELEEALADLKKENIALNNELKSSLTESKQEVMSISSENWNLERSTMRYNEAERELKRLGQQLQQERAQCAVQKQDLETQLFDPRVTTQEQLAHLAELEQKLMAAEMRLRELEAARKGP